MKARINRYHLASKLVWASSTVAMLVASMAYVVLMAFLLWSDRMALRASAEVTAQIMARNLVPAVLFRDAKAADEVLASLTLNEDVESAFVVVKGGNFFARYLGNGVDVRTQEQYAKNEPQVGTHFHWRMLDIIVPVDASPHFTGVHLLLRYSLDRLHRRLGTIAMLALLASIIGVATWSVLQRHLLRPLLQPMSDLLGVMRTVSRTGDYSLRARSSSEDEVGELANNFNRMISQIERRDLALGHELAERKKTEHQLDQAAHFDSVTGLANRHYFNRYVQDLSRSPGARPSMFALLFIDLDNFKYVNDTFGHQVGDALLLSVAKRLKDTLRAGDLVARLGGDEFAVLLDRPKSMDDATRLANNILQALAESFDCEGFSFHIGASIGLAMMPHHARSFDELLSCADAAMYEAKSHGKNNVQVWNQALSERSAQRFSIETGLRQALGNHELSLHYQPIIELATHRVVGMEALMRWRHPSMGPISPAQFIPVAEESRLVVTLGQWAVKTACEQAQNWSQKHGPLYIAVNISARQFAEPGFISMLENIILSSGLPRDLLEIEVTETSLMLQTSDTSQILKALHQRGFRLALDDFGTGYSSLAYLKRLPLGKLKVDRSFIRGLPDDAEDAAITQAILSMAQHMGLAVCAEGIETTSQAAFLRALGCQFGQGYLFGRPMPANEFERFLQQRVPPLNS